MKRLAWLVLTELVYQQKRIFAEKDHFRQSINKVQLSPDNTLNTVLTKNTKEQKCPNTLLDETENKAAKNRR